MSSKFFHYVPKLCNEFRNFLISTKTEVCTHSRFVVFGSFLYISLLLVFVENEFVFTLYVCIYIQFIKKNCCELPKLYGKRRKKLLRDMSSTFYSMSTKITIASFDV